MVNKDRIKVVTAAVAAVAVAVSFFLVTTVLMVEKQDKINKLVVEVVMQGKVHMINLELAISTILDLKLISQISQMDM